MGQCGNQFATNANQMMTRGGGSMMGGNGNHWNLFGFGGMNSWIWIIGLLVIGYLAYLIFKNRQIDKGASSDSQPINSVESESAADILLKEFMRGTITEEEYLQKKAYLN
ncbi:hypothetical protein ACWOFR_01970 [Carnobacterium gallinarum]|uniref:hypothetical protein n=1 Tax=Carnobacterium gallinarum TaxID=2749 RepID=UPI000690B199|nr:hypothetical protein [Carnobacterium gallinarum]